MAMLEGSALESDCSLPDACSNGSSPASNSVTSDSNSLMAKLADNPSSESEVVTADDMYAQLGEKQKDLQLAAHLGQVLLCQNEELRCTNEQMIQEFNAKIEVLFSFFLLF